MAHLRHVLLQDQLLVVVGELVELLVQLHKEDVFLDHGHYKASQVESGVVILAT